MTIAVGGIMLALSACSQAKSVADEPIDITDSLVDEPIDMADRVVNEPIDMTDSLAEHSTAANEKKDVANDPADITDNLAERSTAASEVLERNEPLSDTGKINTVLENLTAEELFDLFINGSVNAVDSSDSTFSITDLDEDAYSVGEQVDLDNDGENELIINGLYGGMYLDARDNKVYKFAGGDGTAVVLSYTYYNGAVWIMYSNQSSAGFEYYHMEKYEGADHLTAEMNFGEEFDVNNVGAGVKYTLNETEISYNEYSELCSKIFAAQVSTNCE